jgi:hypothetical protein
MASWFQLKKNTVSNSLSCFQTFLQVLLYSYKLIQHCFNFTSVFQDDSTINLKELLFVDITGVTGNI